ncbi:MAG: cytochrome c [candidate division Zixibacteria bacterium]
MNRIFKISFLMIISMVLISGCYRGKSSKNEPIHLNPNMDSQAKYKAQSKGEFFADGSAMRQPVEGTVARGGLREDDAYFKGTDRKGNFIKNNPIGLTEDGLNRGRERFGIYCAVCHGAVGDANSIMVEKKYLPPPTFHQDRLRDMPEGEIFNIISNGIRNMPSYKNQISVEDRWLIIQYLRALQKSQNARIDDIPESMREDFK